MADDLRPATLPEIEDALTFALRHRARKRVGDADPIMAQIVAERLVEHLDRAGFVLFRKAPLEGHSQLGRGARPPEDGG